MKMNFLHFEETIKDCLHTLEKENFELMKKLSLIFPWALSLDLQPNSDVFLAI